MGMLLQVPGGSGAGGFPPALQVQAAGHGMLWSLTQGCGVSVCCAELSASLGRNTVL